MQAPPEPAAAGRLRVERVDPSADERWDAYVSAHAGGLVYHQSAWLRVLQREYGRLPLGLALVDARGALRGALPLMSTRGLPLGRGGTLAGRRLSSLPRTPVAGPLADDRDGLAELVRAAVELTPSGARLQLKPDAARLDGLVEGVVGSPWNVTYVLELPARAEDLRLGSARNDSRIRAGIRMSARHRVTVRHAGGLDDLRAWYRLYLDTMRHHLTPARPLRLFEAMWDELRPRGMMRLLLAERDGALLAGSVVLMGGDTAFYAFNGARRTALNLRPNDLLQWQAIADACREGRRRYDLGEVSEGNEGLAAFKRKWGAEGRRLRRYYGPPPAPPDPESGDERGRAAARERAAAVWRRVPLRATALAGRLANRYL